MAKIKQSRAIRAFAVALLFYGAPSAARADLKDSDAVFGRPFGLRFGGHLLRRAAFRRPPRICRAKTATQTVASVRSSG